MVGHLRWLAFVRKLLSTESRAWQLTVRSRRGRRSNHAPDYPGAASCRNPKYLLHHFVHHFSAWHLQKEMGGGIRKRCLNCWRPPRGEWRTGPDGARTLCRGCASKYGKRSLTLYEDPAGNLSVIPSPGAQPVVVKSFRKDAHGVSDMARPVVASAHAKLKPQVVVPSSPTLTGWGGEAPVQGLPAMQRLGDDCDSEEQISSNNTDDDDMDEIRGDNDWKPNPARKRRGASASARRNGLVVKEEHSLDSSHREDVGVLVKAEKPELCEDEGSGDCEKRIAGLSPATVTATCCAFAAKPESNVATPLSPGQRCEKLGTAVKSEDDDDDDDERTVSLCTCLWPEADARDCRCGRRDTPGLGARIDNHGRWWHQVFVEATLREGGSVGEAKMIRTQCFLLTTQITFSRFEELLQALFAVAKPFTVHYKGDWGCNMRVASDEELMEFFAFARCVAPSSVVVELMPS